MMMRDPGMLGIKSETKVYDLEEDIVVIPPNNNQSMVIERGADHEVDEYVRNIEGELCAPRDFGEKRKLYANLVRKANEPRAHKSVKKFMFYALLREMQTCEARLEKSFYLAVIKDNLKRLKIEGEFRTAFTQSLVVLFEIERNTEVSVMILEVLAELCKDTILDNDMKYDIISLMHARLNHADFRMKKNALVIIVLLTRYLENDFLIVFENIMERCIESQNKDLVLIFLQTMSDLDFPLFSQKINKLVVDMIMNSLFSYNKESLIYLLSFLERIVLFLSPNTDLSRNIFIFLCKNMRNLHKEIRKKSIDVLCKMDLRQVGEELLMASIQKEKFEDYQSKKRNHLSSQLPISVSFG